QLVAARELELSQHRGDVRLDGLRGDVEAEGDLLVHVAASDVLEDLALAGGEGVELGLWLRRRPGERVQHEAGEPGGEDGIALVHAPYRLRQLVAGDALGHVAAGAGPDDRDHVLGGVGHRQRKEARRRLAQCRGAADHLHAAAVRHVHVEQHDVGVLALDGVERVLHAARLAGDLEQRLQLRAHARAKELVVVDDEDPGLAHERSNTSSTSVPWPVPLVTRARPPWRSMRPTIDSRTPLRSAGTASGSKPGPRSRTNTCVRESLLSAYTSTGEPPPNLAAFVIASRAAATTASCAASRSRSPTTTTSTGTPCCSSTSAAAASSAPARVPDFPGAGRSDSHARSSRSWRRARAATSAGSPARRCIIASVWSTESCRCAATSARSCERIRAARSSVSERTSRTIHGAKITPSTTTAAITANRTSRAAPSAPVACRKTMPAATTSAMPRPVREIARTARRLSVLTISSGVRSAGAGRGSRSPIDWRQISAPPPAIRTSGHTIASENQMPRARKVRSTARSRKAVPSATSTAARPVLIRTRVGRESPAGITSQPSR